MLTGSGALGRFNFSSFCVRCSVGVHVSQRDYCRPWKCHSLACYDPEICHFRTNISVLCTPLLCFRLSCRRSGIRVWIDARFWSVNSESTVWATMSLLWMLSFFTSSSFLVFVLDYYMTLWYENMFLTVILLLFGSLFCTDEFQA